MDGLEQDRLLLKALCAFAGLTPSRLATEADLSSSTILRPFNGSATTRLSAPTLDKLMARFPDFPDWAQGRDVIAQAYPEMVNVAEIDLRFGLGSAFMDQEIVEHQVETKPFPRAWLRMITTSPPDQLYWARGQGDSMEPKIHEGDVILIDRSQRNLVFDDLIWALAYGSSGMIKRLRQMPDGSVKILSDNPSVLPEIAYDGEVHIFGRVVAVVKRL